MPEYGEYLRRNLVHAGSIGVQAGIEAALRRLKQTKRPQKWLVLMLEGLIDRAKWSSAELAKWRDASDDAPWTEFTREEKLAEIVREIALRRGVYTKRIREWHMKQEEADRRIAIMVEIAKDYGGHG